MSRPSSRLVFNMSIDFKCQDLANRSQLTFKSSDQYLRASLSPFKPSNAPNNNTLALDKDILFQIVGIRDITKSTVSYIESLIELIDANEGFYDRQQKSNSTASNNGAPANQRQRVIHSVNVEAEDQHIESYSSSVMIGVSRKVFKLTLQDSFGNLSFAIELEPIPFLRQTVTGSSLYPIKLGSKLLIKKNTNILFNCFQLKSDNCVFVGGEIEKLNYNLYQRELDNFKRLMGYKG